MATPYTWVPGRAGSGSADTGYGPPSGGWQVSRPSGGSAGWYRKISVPSTPSAPHAAVMAAIRVASASLNHGHAQPFQRRASTYAAVNQWPPSSGLTWMPRAALSSALAVVTGNLAGAVRA